MKHLLHQQLGVPVTLKRHKAKKNTITISSSKSPHNCRVHRGLILKKTVAKIKSRLKKKRRIAPLYPVLSTVKIHVKKIKTRRLLITINITSSSVRSHWSKLTRHKRLKRTPSARPPVPRGIQRQEKNDSTDLSDGNFKMKLDQLRRHHLTIDISIQRCTITNLIDSASDETGPRGH